MSVVIDYDAIEKMTSIDLAEKIKEDVEFITKVSELEKTKIEDTEHEIIIGFTTIGSIYVYRYSKRDKDFKVKRLSIADYWFVQDMWKGDK